jgi:hypothetical protein
MYSRQSNSGPTVDCFTVHRKLNTRHCFFVGKNLDVFAPTHQFTKTPDPSGTAMKTRLVLLSFALSACASVQTSQTAPSNSAALSVLPADQNARIDTLAERYFEELLPLNPTLATSIGDRFPVSASRSGAPNVRSTRNISPRCRSSTRTRWTRHIASRSMFFARTWSRRFGGISSRRTFSR